MKREKAIQLLVNATFSEEWQGNEELTTAYNMAINALYVLADLEKWLGKQTMSGEVKNND